MAHVEAKSAQFRLLPSAPGLFHLHWRNQLIASLTRPEIDRLALRVSAELSKAASLLSPAPVHVPCNAEAVLRLTLPEASELLLMCVAARPQLAQNGPRPNSLGRS